MFALQSVASFDMESNNQHMASVLSTVQCSIEQHSLVKDTLHVVNVILQEQRTGRLTLMEAIGWSWTDTLLLCGAVTNCLLAFLFLISLITYLCVVNIDRLRRIGSDLSVWVAGTGWLPNLMRSQVTGPFDPPAASSGLGHNEMGVIEPLMANNDGHAADDNDVEDANGHVHVADVHGADVLGAAGVDIEAAGAGLGDGREREN